MYKVSDGSEFEKYKNLVNQITVTVLKTQKDRIKIRICEIILKINIEDVKLNVWQKIFYPYRKTGTFFIPINKIEQIQRRCVLRIKGNLLILYSVDN